MQGELDRFGLWLKRRRPKPQLEEVDSDIIIRYIQDRTAFRSKATVSGTMSIIRGVGDYLVREGYWKQNPLRWIQGPKIDWRTTLPRSLDQNVMSTLWQTAAHHRKGFSRFLWIALLSVLYGTGLRRKEIERLNLDSWIGEEGVLEIEGCKNGGERRVIVPELSWRCLESYLIQRHNYLEKMGQINQPALFVNRSGERLTGTAISKGIRNLAQRGNLPRITLHQFRHTCATDLLERGLHVADVQKVLGHKRISTTVR
ncbi:MAG: tyrosine-type recombinase/integrase, partial [Planctomycetes bacterium]|nr:tyrosine-type recombinase/integrase [Planctomycetota bacterium]